MIESRQGAKIKRKEVVAGAGGAVDGNVEETITATDANEDESPKKYQTMGTRDSEIEALRKKNAQLEAELAKARSEIGEGGKSACCTIF